MENILLTVNVDGEVREELLEGVPHLVVPVVMLTEGVHNGNRGAWYYPSEENKKSVPLWDHKPIVVYHPKKDDGTPTTACQPHVLNTRKVGIILNTKYKDKKLKAEAWLNIARTNEIDSRIIENIKNKVKTEVSTGLAVQKDETAGIWNQEQYSYIARDYKPDHLAILPDQVGACSIADGAGLLANAEGMSGSDATLKRSCLNIISDSLCYVKFVNNELSFSQIERSLCDVLSSKFGEKGKYWEGYVSEVYKNYVVFWEKGTLYMMGYSTSESGVTLEGSAEEVVRVVTYEAKDGKSYVSNNDRSLILSPGSTVMGFDKKKHVDELIANKQIDEKDRAVFEALPDATLEKMVVVKNEKKEPPAAPAATPPAKEPELVVNKNETKQPIALTDLPVEMQKQFIRLQNMETAQKKKLVANILNNDAVKTNFSEEFLMKQEIDFLERLLGSVGGSAHRTEDSQYGPPLTTNDYSLAGGFAGETVVRNSRKPHPKDESLPLPTGPAITKK